MKIVPAHRFTADETPKSDPLAQAAATGNSDNSMQGGYSEFVSMCTQL
jgi:hypothetical protein